MKKNKPFRIGEINHITAYLTKGCNRLMDAIKNCDDLTTIRFATAFSNNERRNRPIPIDWQRIYDALIKNISLHSMDIYVDHTEMFQILRRVLKRNHRIKTVNISASNITEEASRHIYKALKFSSGLQNLSFCNAILPVEIWRKISRGIARNTSLKSIEFRFGVYDERSMNIICEALTQNSHIESITFNQPKLHETNIEAITKILRNNTTLKSLEIRGVTTNGIETLGEALKENSSLKKLSLKNCKLDHYTSGFDNSKAVRILISTYQPRVRQPQTTDTITSKRQSFESFCESLKVNTSLDELDLSGSAITDQSICSISEVLTINTSLKTLRLCVNGTSQSRGWSSLMDSLARNDTLTRIDFGSEFVPGSKNSLLEMLRANQAINNIINLENIVGDDYEEVQRAVEKNKLDQFSNEKNSVALLKMMSMRQQQFFSIFPLETWFSIIENFKFAGISTNYVNTFCELLNV